MKTVKFTFVGGNSNAVAQAFYTWVVDGGLEDQLIDELDRLTDDKTSVEGIMDFNNDSLDIAIRSLVADQ
jgi:hypothetical protein